MPDFFVVAPAGRGSLSSGIAAGASLTRRGELINVPWHVQLAMEGKVFSAGMGSIATGITTNMLTAVDITLPMISIQAPSGTTIIPLFINPIFSVTGAALAHALATVADNAPGSGTSSALTRAIQNLKPRGPGSACTGRQVYTVTATWTNQNEFWRATEAADLDSAVAGNGQAGFQWSYLTHAGVPVIVGPGSLNYHSAVGTSSTQYATVVWAEFASADLGLA